MGDGGPDRLVEVRAEPMRTSGLSLLMNAEGAISALLA